MKYPSNLRNIFNELKVKVAAERAKSAEKKKGEVIVQSKYCTWARVYVDIVFYTAQALASERRNITRRIPSSQDTSRSSDPSSSTASCQTFKTTAVTQAMLERERGRPRKEQSKPSQLFRGTTSPHNTGTSSREQSASQDATRFSLSEDSSSIHNTTNVDHNMFWDDGTVSILYYSLKVSTVTAKFGNVADESLIFFPTSRSRTPIKKLSLRNLHRPALLRFSQRVCWYTRSVQAAMWILHHLR
jgi:hypothetical protein